MFARRLEKHEIISSELLADFVRVSVLKMYWFKDLIDSYAVLSSSKLNSRLHYSSDFRYNL